LADPFIPEDDSYESSPQYASPLMNYDSASLLTLALQFIAGIVALYYALPNFITGLLLLSLITNLSTQMFMIVWGILPIVGIVQLYFGFRLYKKKTETIGKAIIIDVFAILLFGIDIVISFFEGLLITYPEVIAYFVMNILLVILLNMASVRTQFESLLGSYQSESYQY
jgi:hypothetical protein